jgi:teichuronic acid biosynthesis glycosyltransferase TuaC
VRALWVTNMWPENGRPWYGSFVRSQAQSLERLGVELTLIVIRGYLSRSEYLRAAFAVRRAVMIERFDVVHAHYGYSGAVACAQSRVPVVISYCGDDLLGTPRSNGSSGRTYKSRATARACAQLARMASATITKSEAMVSALPASCRARNYVIPNGVDLEAFAPIDPGEARGRLGWPSDPPKVLFVGDPRVPTKNFSLAQSVCAELSRRGREVELRVAKDVDPLDMPAWFSAADALLFTSLSEGSPNAIKEAMAAELPVVSAPVGDVPEQLRDIPGMFVVERAVDVMADKLLEALRVGRATAARQAAERLSLERVAERVLDVYTSVAA